MAETASTPNRIKWQFPLFAACGAALPLLCIDIISDSDFSNFLYVLTIVPISSLILLILTSFKKGRRRAFFSALVVYVAISFLLVGNSYEIGTTVRWLLHSNRYKAAVLALPKPANGELRHLEWDGWGFASVANTVVYLVYDPMDSLSAAARSGAPAKVSGIPCGVPSIRRLQSQWYSVMSYTDADWDSCIR